MKMLSHGAETVIKRIKAQGHEAYAVGGCVRDILMGVPPHDFDVCTDTEPTEVLACFKDERVIETGLKHGTVTVMIGGEPIEVTTYRMDGEYTDGRHPKKVRFVKTLEEDLKRRDFTVNAMVMDENGQVFDYFGGREDIQSKTIRCVGDADTRFSEDALRILRALRFASVLDFSIEEETKKSIHRNRERLNLVSKERILIEMNKLLLGDGVLPVLMEYADVFSVFLPPVEPMVGFLQHNPHHRFDVWTHTAYAVAGAEKDLVVRWTLLCHDMGKPRCYHMDEKGVGHFYGHAEISAEMAEDLTRELRMDNKTAQAVRELVFCHDRPMGSRKSVKKVLRLIGADLFDKLLYVQAADRAGKAETEDAAERQENRALRAVYEDILREGDCFSLKELAVNGADLTALGYAGKAVGEELNRLLDLVIDGHTDNTKTALLKAARR